MQQILSNRQKFKLINPSTKTLSLIQSLSLHRPSLPRDQFPKIQFSFGATQIASLPKTTEPEIAVIGRSNVGKSSLLNALTGTSIARVRDRPGHTLQINLYAVGTKGKPYGYLSDMMGYGFAYGKEGTEEKNYELIKEYISERKNTLKRLYVLLDARHGLKFVDKEFLQSLENVKVALLLTKCDLVEEKDLARRHYLVSEAAKEFKCCVRDVGMVSSKHLGGIERLRNEVKMLFGKRRELGES